ncbi:MAG: hypothetical protein R2861_13920 [Desulfobacterales bacterium]
MEQLIKTIPLENNLTLELFDASRKIAADRWQVTLKAGWRCRWKRQIAGSRPDPAKAAEIRQILGVKPSPEVQQYAILLMTGKNRCVGQLMDAFMRYTRPLSGPPGVCQPFCAENLS